MVVARVVLMIVLLAGSSIYADDLFEGAPPVPPGYDDYRQAQAAVLSGAVPMVNMSAPVPETIAAHKDIEYAAPDGHPLKIDLYVPKDAAIPPPVLLFIHGGGWEKGKKEDYAFYNIEFAKLGYATASVQYRLSPEHHFPAAIQDVECAMAWLKDHGNQYGFDGDEMVLLGGSAGGHLALLAAYSQDPAMGCAEGAAPHVRGVVNLYGVVDCTTPLAQEARQVNNFIGQPYSKAAEVYAQASPLHHLDANDPPTLTFHGTIDELVPVSQADTLHEQLDALGVANYYDRIEGWPHTMDLARPINDRCRYVVERFLQTRLPLDQIAE